MTDLVTSADLTAISDGIIGVAKLVLPAGLAVCGIFFGIKTIPRVLHMFF